MLYDINWYEGRIFFNACQEKVYLENFYVSILKTSTYYEFIFIPFGLSTALFTFTKLTKLMIDFLRKRGVLCLEYFDDFLILGNSEQECRKNVKLTVSLLENLAFLVNYEKSYLQPKQTCKFLGYVFDSVNMQITLPDEKHNRAFSLISFFLTQKKCKIRQFAWFIGTLVSICPAVKYRLSCARISL